MNEKEKLREKIGCSQGDLVVLAEAHRDLITTARALFQENLSIPMIIAQINQFHDQIISYTLTLTEEKMRANGFGDPPVPYCWILLGSGGRQEQTLWTDQDNGIIYETPSANSEDAVRSYFQQLAQFGVEALDKVGYPLCPGNVMATNARWCQSVQGWQSQWENWVENPSIKNLKFFLISSDFRFIYGDAKIASQIQQWFTHWISGEKKFLKRLAEHSLVHPIPLGPFGQIFTELWGAGAGKFDIKQGIYVQLVNCLRMWSLQYGFAKVNSSERLRELALRNLWPEKQVDKWRNGYELVLYLRLNQHLEQAEKGLPLNNYVDLKKLTSEQRKQLKSCMRQVKQMRKYTAKYFAQLAGEKK